MTPGDVRALARWLWSALGYEIAQEALAAAVRATLAAPGPHVLTVAEGGDTRLRVRVWPDGGWTWHREHRPRWADAWTRTFSSDRGFATDTADVTEHVFRTMVATGVWTVTRDGVVRNAAGKRLGSAHEIDVDVHGTRTTVAIPRLVWRTFRGPIPPHRMIRPRDGDRANAALRNLRLSEPVSGWSSWADDVSDYVNGSMIADS